MTPASGAPMGIPNADNAPLPPGNVPYVHPMNPPGSYVLKCAAPGGTWNIDQQPPQGAADPVQGQANLNVISPVLATLTGVSPGWVHIWVVNGPILVAEAWYPLYNIKTLEDDVGGALGFDPRYGGFTNAWFPERGGRYFNMSQAEPAADTILGFNDLFAGAGVSWTGAELDDPPENLRLARWMPESQVLSANRGTEEYQRNFNSLIAYPRREEYVRVWLNGPREPNVQVPIQLRITVAANSPVAGQVDPGPGAGGALTYDIIPKRFRPPAPQPQNPPWQLPGAGDWGPPGQPPASQLVIKRNPIDDPPPNEGLTPSHWVLRIPWKGRVDATTTPPTRYLSSTYGDIEVEAVIAPEGWPNGPAKQNGLDPTGMWEGVMQHRRGTVLEVKKITVESREPDGLTAPSGLLKTRWFRMVKYELNRDVVDVERATLSLASDVIAGQSYDDRATQMGVDLWVKMTSGQQDDERFSDRYLAEEATIPAINQQIATDPQEIRWDDAVWLAAEIPDDILRPWYSGTNWVRPQSLAVEVRGLAGIVERNPGSADYAAEPIEFEDDAQNPVKTRKFPVHFINALADVNGDGVVGSEDDSDELEESQAAGLIVNERLGDTPPIDDMNRQKLWIRTSAPTGGFNYTDYEIWLTSPALPPPGSPDSPTFTFTQVVGSAMVPVPWVSQKGAFVIQPTAQGLASNGAPISLDIFSSTENPSPQAWLQVYLVSRRTTGSPPATVFTKEAVDDVFVTFTKWGIDVDSDNDGDVDDEDNELEDWHPGLIVAANSGTTGEAGDQYVYTLRVHQHPKYNSFQGRRVLLSKSVGENNAGGLRVFNSAGTEVLALADDTDTQYEIPEADASGSGTIDYEIRGHDDAAGGECILRIELWTDENVVAAEDLVLIRVVDGNIVIHNGLAGEGPDGGDEITADDEFSPGAITVANRNDTDADGIRDDGDDDVPDELDLCRVILHRPSDGGLDAVLEARINVLNASPGVIWQASTKGTTDMVAGETHTQPLAITGTHAFTEGGETLTRWAEATNYHATALQNITFAYEVRPAGSQNWVPLDRVRVTSIWAEFVQSITAGARPATCDALALVGHINDDTPPGTDNFGFGPFRDTQVGPPVVNNSGMYGTRILNEFRVRPTDVWDAFALTLDVTREIWARDGQLLAGHGAGTWGALLPDDEFTAGDSPNDDPHDDDIDADPDGAGGGLVYIYDTPSVHIAGVGAGSAFLNQRYSFEDFVRVRLGAGAFTDQSVDIQGSRMSEAAQWHHVLYLYRNGVGGAINFAQDGTGTTVSHDSADLFAPAGRAIAATPLLGGAGGVQRGYTLTYTAAAGGAPASWTLASSSGASVTAAIDAAGNCTVEIAGEIRLALTLGGGAAPAGGASTTLALFRTGRAAPGKQNEGDDGALVPAPTSGP